METETYTNSSHLGRKIERIRRLRGMTQTDLGELLGVTKQAISKMEQAEKIDDEKLKQVATGGYRRRLKEIYRRNCIILHKQFL